MAGSKTRPGPVATTDPEAERRPPAALFELANQGDPDAMPAFLDALADPHTLDVYGDVALYAKLALLQQICGKNEATQNAIAIKMAKIHLELVGPDPTPLEGLLADRVVLCWLHVHTLEMNHGTGQGLRPAEANRYQRSLSRAHTRYLNALKALAVVQRLAVPVLAARVRVVPPPAGAIGGK